jgi:hypothetical protein
MTPDYDDSELTPEEMLALAAHAFDDADTAGPIPANADDLEDLLLSRSPEFEAILQRSQQRLEQEGGLTSDEVRRRLGLMP